MENERRLNFRFYCKPPLLLLTGPESPLGGNKRDGKTLGWQEVGGGGGGGKEFSLWGEGGQKEIYPQKIGVGHSNPQKTMGWWDIRSGGSSPGCKIMGHLQTIS